MATLPVTSRAFERTLGKPLRESRAGQEPRGPAARRTFYVRLCQVSIENDYYNVSGSRCPDFSVRPTPSTAALMASLGLLFKDEGAGFSVLYDQRQEGPLANYLLRQQQSDPESWTRLTFTLASTDPYFVSFTAMPIDTNPSQKNLYFSNRQVTGSDREAVFVPAGRLAAGDLRPVIPVQVAVPVPKFCDPVWQVRVLDIAGCEVICKPRCVRCEAVRDKVPEQFTCCDSGDFRCTNVIYLDFSKLPEDLYTIQEVDCSGNVLRSREVIYTVACPVPLCLIDLLFSQPTKVPPSGLYPVRGLVAGKQARFVPVHYVLRFERRSIQWRYYIVPPIGSNFQDLRIESEPATEFRGPRRVELANGRKAYRFASKKTLPLAQRSPFHFRLWGRHDLSTHEQVLVDRLPVASSQQVVPARRGRRAPAHSDIYVYI